MSWRVEWLEEAAKDMRRLGKAEQKQVLKGIAKVSENPLPSSQGGYGKPLRNANRAHLAGLCKIKFRDLGIIWSMTSNPWNKAKGSIDPNEPNRYRHADHVPIYRSRTEMVPYGPLITGRVHKA